jgi:peptide/nickel transport system permease protein
VRRYFARKIGIYILAFWFAGTLDFLVPRLMPGDPVQAFVQNSISGNVTAQQYQGIVAEFRKAFGLNVPLWDQYWHFWLGVLHGQMGISLSQASLPVTSVIRGAAIYTLILLVPAIVLSYVIGNRIGAMAARRKALDNTVLPVGYIFQASPYPWLAMATAFYLGAVARWFPIGSGYAQNMLPSWSNWHFIWSVMYHWFLPFITIFLVSFGGWAIGMRSLVIYELETDYSRYLRTLGASQRLVRRYAYRNASLPQLSGVAIQLGTVIGGNVVTEEVFQYPGLGHLLIQATDAKDYFLLMGIFLFIIIGVLIANFLIDIAYIVIDPRTRLAMQGAQA